DVRERRNLHAGSRTSAGQANGHRAAGRWKDNGSYYSAVDHTTAGDHDWNAGDNTNHFKPDQHKTAVRSSRRKVRRVALEGMAVGIAGSECASPGAAGKTEGRRVGKRGRG